MISTSWGRRNRLLATLDAPALALLKPHATELEFRSGTLLQEAGETTAHVYFPFEGMISLLAVMADGRAIETATVGREGCVGAMSGFGARPSFTRAVVQLPLTAARIPSARFRAATAASEQIRNLVVGYNEVLLGQVQQTAACNALHPAAARFARWLLQARDRTDSDELPLTQEFLAQMLGVRRTTVTQIARQLEKAGIVRSLRGRVFIVNRKKLEETACECNNALRKQLTAELPKIAL